MLSAKTLGLLLTTALTAQGATVSTCAADRCFAQASLPPKLTPIASSFCLSYLKTTAATVTATVTTVKTSVNTVTTTFTPPANPATVTNTVTAAVTQTTTLGTTCVVTSSTTLPTVTNYQVRGTPGGVLKRSVELEPRASPSPSPSILADLVKGCDSKSLSAKLSSACSCFLKTATVTVTTTQTSVPTVVVTKTAATAAPVTVTVTAFNTVVVTAQPCTSTSTQYTYAGQFSCGVPSPSAGASGPVTCTQGGIPAGQTNSPFRIEGGSEGNIFDGCIVSGPKDITTPSGGTHRCDGTNNNANPNPGATLTTDIDSAGQQEGFNFDGTYSNQFQDFFINRISTTAQSGNAFWGVLSDRIFTPSGGCQSLASTTSEGLWAFDAFAPNRIFLGVSPGYQAVTAGQATTVTVNINGANGNDGSRTPVQGATFGQSGRVSDASGNLVVDVPTTPGCYLYKAETTNAIRSNAFYLTVLPASS